jgi:hypothetical protein
MKSSLAIAITLGFVVASNAFAGSAAWKYADG